MAYLTIGVLALGAIGIVTGMTIDHEARLDHHSGAVMVSYRGDVTVSHKQVGAVTPGGRAASLRCDWASMTVDRLATAASGASMVRRIDSDHLVTGTRPGWCSTSSAAIAKELAGKAAALKLHLQALAEEDHHELRAELDRVHGSQRSG